MYIYIYYNMSSNLQLFPQPKKTSFLMKIHRSNLEILPDPTLCCCCTGGAAKMLLIGAAKKHRWRSGKKISRISRFAWSKIAVLFSKMSHIITYHHFFGRLGVMNEVGHETAVPHRGSTRRTHSGGFLTHSEWVRISEPRKGEVWADRWSSTDFCAIDQVVKIC